SEAPFANVILTTFLYVSPVQMIPSCDHVGTPLHFHSSTTSGSASLTSARSRPSSSPRQSPSSSMAASISSEGVGTVPILLTCCRAPAGKLSSRAVRAARAVTVVGCHAGGEVGNVVVGGVIAPCGDTVFERMVALRADDRLRRLLLREPRGSVAVHA